MQGRCISCTNRVKIIFKRSLESVSVRVCGQDIRDFNGTLKSLGVTPEIAGCLKEESCTRNTKYNPDASIFKRQLLPTEGYLQQKSCGI